LDLPWLPRDNSIGEPQYFGNAMERLGAETTGETFLAFMRYSRISGFGPFHLIDQDRFSLGDSIATADALWHRKVSRPLAKCSLPTQPLKVLFHINGGLPIKNYPANDTKTLLRALKSLGIAVSVIDRPDLAGLGANGVVANTTESLREAVTQHHIFVGLDSFPHHFVRNALGWPTIGLFGHTTAANFGGAWDSHYRSLDASMPCHPCSGDRECPVFRRKDCVNYAKPQQIISAILQMAADVYGFNV
jgi:ADP-heptose:LPS heptosyltransferase